MRASLLAWVVACLVAPGAARPGDREESGEEDEGPAVDFDFSVLLANRFHWKSNFLNPAGTVTAVAGPGSGRGAGAGTVLEDPLNLRFNQDVLGYSALLSAAGRLGLGEHVGVHLRLDSGEVEFAALTRRSPSPVCRQDVREPTCGVTSNGQAIADEAAQTGFVREAYLQLELGPGGFLDLGLGKRLLSLGDGFVVDNYVLGLSLAADLDQGFELPWRARLAAFLPDGSFTARGKRSPFVQLEAAYLFSFLEELGLSFAWYHDGDASLADILHVVLSEAALAGGLPAWPLYVALQLPTTSITTRGELFWVGLHGRVVFESLSLGGTALLSFGALDLAILGTDLSGQRVERRGRAQCLGGMLDLDLTWDLSDDLSLGAFFLFQSGETFGPDDLRDGLLGRYTSFLSVYPFITRTNLFFSGGMNESFSARAFSTSGVNGRGVLAPGLVLGWDLAPGLGARLVSAVLFSHGAHLLSGDHFYGWETDLMLRWQPIRYVALLLEADYFLTGGFFDFPRPVEAPLPEDRTLTREPDAWKLLLGLDISY